MNSYDLQKSQKPLRWPKPIIDLVWHPKFDPIESAPQFGPFWAIKDNSPDPVFVFWGSGPEPPPNRKAMISTLLWWTSCAQMAPGQNRTRIPSVDPQQRQQIDIDRHSSINCKAKQP